MHGNIVIFWFQYFLFIFFPIFDRTYLCHWNIWITNKSLLRGSSSTTRSINWSLKSITFLRQCHRTLLKTKVKLTLTCISLTWVISRVSPRYYWISISLRRIKSCLSRVTKKRERSWRAFNTIGYSLNWLSLEI
jgi:hypothetical protein